MQRASLIPVVRATYFYLAAAIMLGLAGWLSWRSIQQYSLLFGMYHDDALYLVTAKALSENLGYRIISLPGDPIETKYPIGYPSLLSLIWRADSAFPHNLLSFEIFQTIVGITAMLAAAVYLIKTRKVTPLLSLVIFSASVLNYHFLDFLPMVMSDLLCALISIQAFWHTERQTRKPAKLRGAVTLGLLYSAIILVRSQGAVAVLSCLVFLLWRKRFRCAVLALIVVASVAAAQWFWQISAQKAVSPFLAYYTSYSHAYKTLPPASEIWASAWPNWQRSTNLQIETHFPFVSWIPFSSLSPLQFELVYKIGYLAALLPLAIGCLSDLRRGGLLGIYAFLYSCFFFSWPARLEWRHIVVMLPITYYLYFKGARILARLLKPLLSGRGTVRGKPPDLPMPGGARPASARSARAIYRLLCLCGAVLFATYLVAGSTAEAIIRAGQYGNQLSRHSSVFNPRLLAVDYGQAFDWIKGNTGPTDVFVCNNDPLLYLHTLRKAVAPSRFETWRFAKARLVDPASLIESIQFSQAKYLMNDPSFRAMGHISAQCSQSLVFLASHYPGSLVPVFRSPHGLIYIFEINRDRLPKEFAGVVDPNESTNVDR